MKYLKIENDGLLDIRLVALMGGTTKANDIYKIGQFGTGLKYTLAYLFRNNLDFKIFVGEEPVSINTEKETIREEDFEIICINGHRTSITTRMGMEWSAWMILRELWCNALDEGGAAKAETELLEGTEGKTTFYIQIDSEVRKVLNDWGKYFIHEQTPVWSNNHYALYPAGDHLCIYKQGVLIYEDEKYPAVFGYDMKGATINEMRELQISTSYVITCCLAGCDENAARYFLENVKENHHYEGTDNMSYDWYMNFSDSWKKAIGTGKLIYQKVIEDMQARGNEVDLIDKIVVPRILYKALSKQFDGIGALRVASKMGDFYEDYDEEIENRVKQGLAILESCGYVMHPDLEFRYGFFENKSILAQVNLDKRIVFVSRTLVQKPLFTVVGMLIEENEHFNTGMSDNTREFQQHFIDLYTRSLLAQHEIEI